ncbi:MAG: hypothetical protein GVY24_07010 [Planctomycetes bacterium]|jgi:hypothetical protein|nr:hypothetical protein [Planctomycetota bacterium]
MKLKRTLKDLRRFGAVALTRPFDRRDPACICNAAPIIIGGSPRSGTTLLRVMLDSHHRLCCGPESELLFSPAARLDVLADRFDLADDELAAIARRSPCRAAFVEGLFDEYARRQGKARWAEKSPDNVHHLADIFAGFPEARFIHIIRDGRDTVCSLRTHPRHRVVDGQLIPRHTWRPIDQCARIWVDAVEAGLAWSGDARCLELRYEDLVAEPRHAMGRVLGFLDEPWDEAVLHHEQVASSSRDVRKFPQNPEATGAIATTSLSRWQHDLGAEDRATVEQIAGDLLVRLGYAADGRWASW